MLFQLRDYEIKPGQMEQWIEEWRSQIVPLRRRFGFHVLGAWTVEGTNRFVWILSYDGSRTWREADADYYASPERKAMSPDPARHFADTQATLMEEVPTPPG